MFSLEEISTFNPKEDKLVLLLLDGWDLSRAGNLSFYHPYFNPFYFNLFQNSRSLALKREKQHHPIRTFYSGSEVLGTEALLQKYFDGSLARQSVKAKKIVDTITKSGGRLWYFVPDHHTGKVNFSKIIQNSPVSKLGIVANGNLRLNHNNSQDLMIKSFNDLVRLRKIINPEDVVIYLCDSSEWSIIGKLCKKQKFQALKYFVLSDMNNEQLFETLLDDDKSSDLRDTIRTHGYLLREDELNPKNKKLDENHVFIYHLPEDYFDFDLPQKLISKRNEDLIFYIQNLLKQHNCKLIISSRFGSSKNTYELLPLIFANYRQTYQVKSVMEDYLKLNCTIADVAPTILDYLSISDFSHTNGRSLLPFLLPEFHIGEHEPISRRVPASDYRSLF